MISIPLGIHGAVFHLGLFGVLFWTIFLVRKSFGMQYKPYKFLGLESPERKNVSVVIPAYNENASLLEECIFSVVRNNPGEVLVVFNGEKDTSKIEYIKKIFKLYTEVKVYVLEEADKRKAMLFGVQNAQPDSEIIAFVDSDVRWEISTLTELLKPFIDSSIGGVATHQIIDNANASVWTAIGSWLTHQGLTTGSAFQSVAKCASCLRGRTAAYRKRLFSLGTFSEEFVNEYFNGMRCTSGDDGRLTFLTLKNGYGTFVQSTAVVHTTLKEKMIPFLKFRLRCNRNTYRRYLGAISEAWFWKMSWRFKLEFIASFVIPLGFIFAASALVAAFATLKGIYAVFLFTWFCVGRMIRSPQWIAQKPTRVFYFPLMVLAFVFPLLFIRWYALFTLKKNSWGTR